MSALGLASATELAAMIARKELSATELLEHYLARAEQINGALNAIVTFDEARARLAAARADETTMSGAELGPLHGLAITIKDAIETEGVTSTGGAEELSDYVPSADAPVVSSLKEAGAIVFGKTNVPKWSGDIQAYNSMFGTTNSPWDGTRTPGGSSGGAAAAVAAGLTSFEIGTDIGGSIRLPAHFSGVCGHKPSFGIVPQAGYLDHLTSSDQPADQARASAVPADVNVVGPLARSVSDLELLLDVISGPNEADSAAWRLNLPAPRHSKLGDFRVAAWLDDVGCPVGSEVATLLEAAVAKLVASGAKVDRKARPGGSLGGVETTGLPLIFAATSTGQNESEFEAQVAAVSASRATPSQRASVMRHRDWLLLQQQQIVDRACWKRFFRDFDVMLCPVTITPAFAHTHEGGLYERTVEVDGAARPYVELVHWAALVGYVYLPSTVVPIGLTPTGLPVGIQVIAPYLEDRTGLRFARHIEQLLGGFQVPPIARLSDDNNTR